MIFKTQYRFSKKIILCVYKPQEIFYGELQQNRLLQLCSHDAGKLSFALLLKVSRGILHTTAKKLSNKTY